MKTTNLHLYQLGSSLESLSWAVTDAVMAREIESVSNRSPSGRELCILVLETTTVDNAEKSLRRAVNSGWGLIGAFIRRQTIGGSQLKHIHGFVDLYSAAVVDPAFISVTRNINTCDRGGTYRTFTPFPDIRHIWG